MASQLKRIAVVHPRMITPPLLELGRQAEPVLSPRATALLGGGTLAAAWLVTLPLWAAAGSAVAAVLVANLTLIARSRTEAWRTLPRHATSIEGTALRAVLGRQR